MQLFQFGRTKGFPVIYHINQSPVNIDVIEIIIISSFFIIAVAFILIIPGYGKKKSIYTIIKAMTSVLIGASLMISNYGQEWEVGEVNSTIPYRAGEKRQIVAHITIKMGLHSINITLQEMSHGRIESPLKDEMIKYNERFPWIWEKAGNLQMSTRQAKRSGLPIPILWILDYLSIDGEGLRHERFYRMAGWYSHVLLWSAFTAWILVNIFSQSIGRYAAYFIGVIGGLEITSCIIWIFLRNPTPLVIRFPDGEITTSFGWTFWLTCVGGFLCVFLASTLIIMDLRYPDTLAAFLGIDILDQYDECVVRTNELDQMTGESNHVELVELGTMAGQIPSKDLSVVLLKRRSSIKRAQKKLMHISTVPMKIYDSDGDVVSYANEQIQPGSSARDDNNIKFKPPIPKRNMM